MGAFVLLAGSRGTAQTLPPTATATKDHGPSIELVVVPGRRLRGAALGDIAPLFVLDPADIQSFGAGSIPDLLDALKAQTEANGAKPVILLNGRRVSGRGVIKDLPTEAIERLEILPEREALRYGYGAGQRVVNIVLREHFRALTSDFEGEGATQGGAGASKDDLNFTLLENELRYSLDLKYEHDDPILASERHVLVAPVSPFDIVGNITAPPQAADPEIDARLSALAGVPVTLAGVPKAQNGQALMLADFVGLANAANAGDLSPYLSLRPSTEKMSANAVISGSLFGSVTGSLNAALDDTRRRSDQGLATGALLIPPSDPFSPFAAPVELYRYLAEAGPLASTQESIHGHLGLSLDGVLSDWVWSMTAGVDHDVADTSTQTGIDVSHIRSLLDGGGPALDPFTPFPAGLLTGRMTDRARSISDTASVSLVANGDIAELPAGRVSATVRLGGDVARTASRFSANGTTDAGALSRNEGDAGLTLDVPLTSKENGVLPMIGSLSSNLDLDVRRISDFGTLKNATIGLAWAPIERIGFVASLATSEDAPQMAILENPTVITPNVTAFDFLQGRTVEVTEVAGGNRNVVATRNHVSSATLTVIPFAQSALNLIATYSHSNVSNPIESLPVPTAAIEAAFPDRFVRNGAGQLVTIDTRSVNFAGQRTDQLRWGLSYFAPLSSLIGGNPAATPVSANGPGKDHEVVQFSIFHTWVFTDRMLIRQGLPAVDLLNGGSAQVAGGQPAHQVEFHALVSGRGMGEELDVKWQSATWTNNGSAIGNLFYSSLATADLRLFANVDAIGAFGQAPWAHGMRITLTVDNIFDARQRVHNGLGETPEAFQAGYIDPVGRLVRLDLRKAF